MSKAPTSLRLVVVNPELKPTDPLHDPDTLIGAAYQSALLKVAGVIPDTPLPEEAMKLFKEQVAALPNMKDVWLND